MLNTCTQCSAAFEITQDDLDFYEKVSPVFNGKKELIPPPTLCPECRDQRRMAWCNELNLYHNKCAKTGKPVISYLHPSNPRPVWNFRDWWSDAWDGLQYGRDIDWDRPVFEQISDLERVAPHACINTDLENENSEYTHYAGHEKNCYLMFHTSYAEDCQYGYGVKKSKNCVDTYYCHESELCYECIDVKNCYGLTWCQECQNCSSSHFLRDCIGCQDCFLCIGLRSKKFCIANEQLTEEEYRTRMKDVDLGSYAMVKAVQEKFTAMQLMHPRKYAKNEMTERSTGDYMTNAKNTLRCFDVSDTENCSYCSQLQLGARDCHDIYQFGIGIELCNDSAQIGYNIYGCSFCFELLENCNNLLYCISCFACKDCFGCFGLRHHQYCIFNKQYTKEEYEKLVPRLIERMKKDNEWGEFFPVNNSQSAYNETMAFLRYPMTKNSVLVNGWSWLDEPLEESYLGPQTELPDNIIDATDDLCRQIFICETSGKPYKIIPQELAFCRQMKVPLPRKAFLGRHQQRFEKRNPRKLWNRACAKCAREIETTYAPERPEIVYCEDCYLQTVY